MATPEGAEKITEERAAEALQQLTVEDLGVEYFFAIMMPLLLLELR